MIASINLMLQMFLLGPHVVEVQSLKIARTHRTGTKNKRRSFAKSFRRLVKTARKWPSKPGRASDSAGAALSISPARTERAVGFAPAEVASIGRAVASALEYLHTEHRLMHGDVKSANILLSRDLSCIAWCPERLR